MTKLTYTQNRLTGQYIIQLIIDQEDLLLPKFVPVQNAGMSVSEHLIYLAQLTAAIDAAQQAEESMIDTILSPDLDDEQIDEVEPQDDLPAWDEDAADRDYDDEDNEGVSDATDEIDDDIVPLDDEEEE